MANLLFVIGGYGVRLAPILAAKRAVDIHILDSIFALPWGSTSEREGEDHGPAR
jgi:hypothetical protein